ncbi:type II secretion system protein, partial [bacterium]|nr:type II secretion system protein [bacterium]
RSGLSFIGALLHRRQIFDWKHHALVLISYVKNLRNRRSLLLPLRGFTLAEVLITLGIIGVVAALTIPTLMQKTDDKETVAKLKKNVKIFQDAMDMAVLEHGTPDKWGLIQDDSDSNALITEYLKPHLKVQKDCGQTTCSDYPVETLYTLSGTPYSQSDLPFPNLSRLILADGTVALLRSIPMETDENSLNVFGTHIQIFIDTNGKKEPNTLGKDIFPFVFKGDGKLGFMMFGKNPNETGWAACNPHAQGWSCTTWVYFKENLDYLRCADDLRWDGPTKCP